MTKYVARKIKLPCHKACFSRLTSAALLMGIPCKLPYRPTHVPAFPNEAFSPFQPLSAHADPSLPYNCRDILTRNPSAGSGTYTILFNGREQEVSCDMETDGGGWMLVLNYYHAAGTTPPTYPRTTAGFPVQSSSATLGTDESLSGGVGGAWGHLAPSAFAQVSLPSTQYFDCI